MLSQKTMDIIKATAPVLEVTGTEITTKFYQMLFDAHPELLNIFNHTNQKQGRQQTALANAVYAAAVNIERLEAILPAVGKIAHKHRSLGVKPEHYPVVGEFLLKAIKEVLQDGATEEILQAWAEAYGVIADVFISLEKEMYKEAEAIEGGWNGFKEFIITKKVEESSVITSFYLKPADKSALPSYLPGQYITVQLQIPGENYTQNRQYSLSSAYTPDYYRISVKREDEQDPNGTVSPYLHTNLLEGDSIFVSVPAGDFYIDVNDQAPITLISGGVGVTPMYSMLESITQQNSARPVTFIHAARSQAVHAFAKEVAALADSLQNGKSYVVYEQGDNVSDFTGYLTPEILKQIVDQQSSFYVCGPVPFMKAVINALAEIGVPAEQVHYEFFGPAIAI
ncbi:NO-inducible flavohemoprotein [Jeotgalibacillus proteolyticus]|uniref:Flavohemoprotein n=1 Tax=Jeotgalibacillus proteolyticus TaxID=2082395 RepID=A0A2S5GCS6_9BACL|nr:NO-inducible flavohemoprotein [Jeotgalibacillus proteolyticus]PPA70799.1 NO-inducible flavohemoprotein [Jeotgalibacillus proteolyticus]